MNMPDIVARYFNAGSRNEVDELVSTFTTDAIVEDEHAQHQGTDAIRGWWIEAKQASQFVAEPLDATSVNDTIQVLAKVSGKFSGSPVLLKHVFTLSDGKIAKLEIR